MQRSPFILIDFPQTPRSLRSRRLGREQDERYDDGRIHPRDGALRLSDEGNPWGEGVVAEGCVRLSLRSMEFPVR